MTVTNITKLLNLLVDLESGEAKDDSTEVSVNSEIQKSLVCHGCKKRNYVGQSYAYVFTRPANR